MARRLRSSAGFSLPEMLISITVLLIVSSIVTSALMQMTKQQQTIWNRTEMHSGVRGATELLQQEVGQAGRITLPANVWISANAVVGLTATPTACLPATVTLSSDLIPANPLKGLWYDAASSTGIGLTFLGMDNTLAPPVDATETVLITDLDPVANTVTGCFWHNHAAGAQGVGTPVVAQGGFANGIVPPTGVVNGSNANLLKMFGDINGDGKLVYVEYYCDNGDAGTAGSHNLYRNIMDFDILPADKPPLDNSKILLSNIYPNPLDASGAARPCFEYQTKQQIAQGTVFTFVLDVAVTLTAQTAQVDPITKQYQTETKALLNVSPRNVYNAFSLAGLGYTDHIQSTPATVSALLQ
jgi:prepilin-type N-terminal cleavage/methylation domain-containing protein